jgi:hypothetical protein
VLENIVVRVAPNKGPPLHAAEKAGNVIEA